MKTRRRDGECTDRQPVGELSSPSSFSGQGHPVHLSRTSTPPSQRSRLRQLVWKSLSRILSREGLKMLFHVVFRRRCESLVWRFVMQATVVRTHCSRKKLETHLPGRARRPIGFPYHAKAVAIPDRREDLSKRAGKNAWRCSRRLDGCQRTVTTRPRNKYILVQNPKKSTKREQGGA